MSKPTSYQRLKISLFSVQLFIFCFFFSSSFGQTETHIRKKFEIKDGIAPKSVVASGHGLFAAQNMMYRHTITLYNQDGTRLSKINDAVQLSSFGIQKYGLEKFSGSPVEGVFTKDGKYLWVSNYYMTGPSFTNPGGDDCIGNTFDPSFIYKINTATFQIEQVIEVGSVPKFLAISSNEKWLLVSNWVSSDVSIIELETETEVKRITVGAHPRGIAITADERQAYITLMGSTQLIEIDLETFEKRSIDKIGNSPRSILLAAHDSILYVSLNGSNELVQYNRHTAEKKTCKTAAGPRSMTLSPDEKSLYVVNYFDHLFTKIDTKNMAIEAEIKTAEKPIGICGNWIESEIWVACYSGKIEVFKDFKLARELHPTTFFDFNWPTLFDFEYDSSKKPILTTASTELEPTNFKSETRKYFTPEKPKEKQRLLKSQPASKVSFHLIVGAFSIQENAIEKQKSMLVAHIGAEILQGDKYTYVTAGSYSTELEAEVAKKQFVQSFPTEKSAWILKKE